MPDYIFEKFNTVYEFEKALNTRKVNDIFKKREADNLLASNDGDFTFTQTNNYKEADLLLENGYDANTELLKKELNDFKKTVIVKRNKMKNDVYGFAPNVPNAIRGVPKSMINYKKIQKNENKRILHIIYNQGASGDVNSEILMKCGVTILKLALLMDLNNVKTKIDIIPKMSECNGEYAGCIVNIKNYKQPFNLSKISYPLSHASFFRRHGFRWLETASGITKSGFAGGYGKSMQYLDDDEVAEYFNAINLLDDNSVYICVNDIVNADYNVDELMMIKKIN